jgi:phosphoserine phosphatase
MRLPARSLPAADCRLPTPVPTPDCRLPTAAIRLVIFDCDGVLADADSSWEYVHRAFGTDNNTSLLAYLQGEFDDREFIRRDVRLWTKGTQKVPAQKIRAILDKIPMMTGAPETVSALKARGIKTAIVSAGMNMLIERVARLTGVDINLSNGVLVDEDGFLTGEGFVNVPVNDKGAAVRNLVSELGYKKSQCAAVGDRGIDCGMFEHVGLKIAFNPADEEVCDNADVVIRTKDLREILKYIY